MEKVTSDYEVLNEIDLRPFVDDTSRSQPSVYQLQTIILYDGTTPNRGHYSAIVKMVHLVGMMGTSVLKDGSWASCKTDVRRCCKAM